MVLLSLARRGIMRAVRVHKWGGPEVLTVDKAVPVPVPGDTQVLIRVQASGVNPVDTYIRSGTYARLPQLPYVPGSDAAGVVEAVGEKVTNFKKGDRAYSARSVSGAYAEYTVSDTLHTGHLSEKLSFSQGAALGVPYYTAYRALVIKGKVKAGETVLVHGASGAVGLASVQIATSLGLRVLGTAGTQEGMDVVKANGAADVFNHREEGYTDKILSATGGEGPDVIVEMLSNVNLQRDLEIIKSQGRILVIGCRGTVEVNPRLMMGKELQVNGIMLASSTPEDWRETTSFLEAGAEEGWLKPCVCKEYPLEDAPAAHHDIINKTASLGKLVLKM
ncbi:quinone oxidoreductase-like [Babylonia areolata]|uniref:quinone oxidoreductase-like n=1 Tax=Babylonia areolata TaxID=304850 RepID=UPI003FCF7D2A